MQKLEDWYWCWCHLVASAGLEREHIRSIGELDHVIHLAARRLDVAHELELGNGAKEERPFYGLIHQNVKLQQC